jgi:hypothetical protein
MMGIKESDKWCVEQEDVSGCCVDLEVVGSSGEAPSLRVSLALFMQARTIFSSRLA